MDFAFAAVVAAYALAAPYTKVEESFYMQAVHDALAGRSVDAWDHVAFPGAVPRSFVGPLAVAAAAWPARVALGRAHGLALQLAARLAVGLAVALANAGVRRSVGAVFGRRAAWWYGALSVSQFHTAFWASRLLSNTLALVPVLAAQAAWLQCLRADAGLAARQACYRRMLLLLALACVVLRFDTAAFALPMAAVHAPQLLTRRTACVAAGAAVALAALSTAVDSALWRRAWLWPEAHAFVFNVVRGRSAEWGTAPPLHYVTRLLPRIAPLGLPLALAGGASDRRAALLLAATAASVAAFSANAHKEWRFVLPAVPVLNACAACAVARLRPWLRRLAGCMCLASLCAAAAMAYASSLNYPGGHALAQLHALEPARNVSVHIDAYAAMTGVTRFVQTRPGWRYAKTEGLAPGADYAAFAYLLTADPQPHLDHGFAVVAVQDGYAGVEVRPRAVLEGRLPVAVRRRPLVWILARGDSVFKRREAS
ncbi:dolichyl-P-Man:Man(7)GlcNAc(2)-PP-dolichol alpha-1,6-mannosyltransferase [Coemansia erecta]|uniref:Mannosyltransferase n=1 Tax=Coemansia erecta TaxID=147472 RepID=A0A9W7Y4D4_9FUNG|nr:dolichyl-P-Man:Man(7)GlcNAc(2)-PP-dolichol alpha-1,6-mannosyltransferase [Coemansia erecta]